MIRYILNRVLSALLTMFVLATATFFLLRLVPGDPFAGPKVTPEVKERLRIHYGLDKPLPEQYVIYMGNLLRGDFGYSLAKRGHHVNTIIKDAFPQSLDLGIPRHDQRHRVPDSFSELSLHYTEEKSLDYFTVILIVDRQCRVLWWPDCCSFFRRVFEGSARSPATNLSGIP